MPKQRLIRGPSFRCQNYATFVKLFLVGDLLSIHLLPNH
jgi:hypothetical protein